MTRLTNEQAIKQFGIDAIIAADSATVDFTNRVTDGTYDHGYTEFSGETDKIRMFCFVETSVLNRFDLDDINWVGIIQNGAEYEEV
tara:strand:+ start:551 stop:808 length:258 start_codon:yes stop_codon:yes gene_type:complete